MKVLHATMPDALDAVPFPVAADCWACKSQLELEKPDIMKEAGIPIFKGDSPVAEVETFFSYTCPICCTKNTFKQ